MRKILMVGAALAAAGALSSFAGTQSGTAEVGDEISYKFRKPIENGMGLAELADLRGKPVIVEFWGTK